MSSLISATPGIFLLDKQLQATSQRAISEVKRKFKLDKIGHCGTLDPMATGLLICLTGRATRLASYAEKNDKIYSGKIQFGIQTTTDDLEGEVIRSSSQLPTLAEVSKAISEKFTGTIEQLPPAFSALKINGKRAYKLARAGETVELKTRQVQIASFDFDLQGEFLQFRIQSSVGTYIRSIARELGELLGCGGTIASLRREASLPFDLSAAKTIDQLEEVDLKPWESLFPTAIRIEVTEQLARQLQNGLPKALSDFTELQDPDHKYLIYQFNSKPLGLIVNNANKWEFAFRADA